MTQAAEPNLVRIDSADVRQQLAGKHVCPFCGVIRADQTQPCPRCTMEDTTSTRSATRQRIGPWFVLQARNPSAPGMKFATLISLAKKGHVTPRSIVRGPTTHQLWTFAAKVRGLSREFGLCAHCGDSIELTAINCRHCDRPQEPPVDPDTLLEAGAPTAPEMVVTATTVGDSGMDGGTSLDLQVDDGFGMSVTRPVRPSTPSIASANPSPPSVTSSLPISASRTLAPARPPMTTAAQPEEAILTARELAAAFQLEFKQPAGGNPARGLAAAARTATPPASARAATGRTGSEKESRGGGLFKTAAALLLIAAIAVAIVMGLRPDLRDKSVAWLNDTWTSIKSSLDAPAGKPATPSSSPPASNTPGNNTSPAVKPSPKPPVVDARPPVVSPPSVPAIKPDQTPSVVANEVPKPLETPKPAAPKPPAPKPIEPPVAPTPAPKPASTPIVIDSNLTVEQATEIAKDLRNRGIDAEASRDWAGALRIYEQIEKLPRDAWPADLQTRLDRARARLK